MRMTGRPGNPSVDGDGDPACLRRRPGAAGRRLRLRAPLLRAVPGQAGGRRGRVAGRLARRVAGRRRVPALRPGRGAQGPPPPARRGHARPPGGRRTGPAAGAGPVRGGGIGTALVRAGEDTARRLGHDRITLGVGLDNPRARRLYERLGYSDWGHGHTVASWREQRPGSAAVTVTIDWLVKQL